jgi:hypothetical protein
MALARILVSQVFVLALVVVAACGTQQHDTPSAPPSSTTTSPYRSVVDPFWLELADTESNWKLIGRDVRRDRQTLSLQPRDETFDLPDCPGCNQSPATAVLTVYAWGAYDSAAVTTGERVTVNGVDGYYLPARWPKGAVLAWRYDQNNWATVQGRTTMTADLDRLRDLAARFRPAERSPVRFPLRLEKSPDRMPLAWIDDYVEAGRSRLAFDTCGRASFGDSDAGCAEGVEHLTITLARADDFEAYRVEDGGKRRELYTVPVKIGGRDGFLNEEHTTEAAIKVAPGVLIEFAYGGSAERFPDVLSDVVWAPDVSDQSSWIDVADWT